MAALLLRAVPILIPVSAIPLILPKMQYWVWVRTQDYSPFRYYHVTSCFPPQPREHHRLYGVTLRSSTAGDGKSELDAWTLNDKNTNVSLELKIMNGNDPVLKEKCADSK